MSTRRLPVWVWIILAGLFGAAFRLLVVQPEGDMQSQIGEAVVFGILGILIASASAVQRWSIRVGVGDGGLTAAERDRVQAMIQNREIPDDARLRQAAVNIANQRINLMDGLRITYLTVVSCGAVLGCIFLPNARHPFNWIFAGMLLVLMPFGIRRILRRQQAAREFLTAIQLIP